MPLKCCEFYLVLDHFKSVVHSFFFLMCWFVTRFLWFDKGLINEILNQYQISGKYCVGSRPLFKALEVLAITSYFVAHVHNLVLHLR